MVILDSAAAGLGAVHLPVLVGFALPAAAYDVSALVIDAIGERTE